MNEELFGKENTTKNADNTDCVARVSTPRTWMICLAAIIFVGSFWVWGFLGEVPIRTSAIGIVKDQEVTFYISAQEVIDINENMEVLINGVSHPITRISKDLVSIDEIKTKLNEKEINDAKLGEWNFESFADAQGIPNGIINVSVVTDKVKAFTYMQNQAKEAANE